MATANRIAPRNPFRIRYALIALAFVLVYKASRIVNFVFRDRHSQPHQSQTRASLRVAHRG